jgi:hypothetical protein
MLTFSTPRLLSLCLAIAGILSLSCIAAATPKPGHHVGGGSSDDHFGVPPAVDTTDWPDADRPSVPNANQVPDSPFNSRAFWNKPVILGLDACPNYPSVASYGLSSPFAALPGGWGSELSVLDAQLGMLDGSTAMSPFGYYGNQMALSQNPYAGYAPWVGPCTALNWYWSP